MNRTEKFNIALTLVVAAGLGTLAITYPKAEAISQTSYPQAMQSSQEALQHAQEKVLQEHAQEQELEAQFRSAYERGEVDSFSSEAVQSYKLYNQLNGLWEAPDCSTDSDCEEKYGRFEEMME